MRSNIWGKAYWISRLLKDKKKHPIFSQTLSGVSIGVLSYQVEDEEGRIHLLLHLPIEEESEDRWCLWRPDHGVLIQGLF